ncbi:extracellular solute-binding protein [Anabaena sp. FACHB-1237]|uniref:extracellular solute-binding protein n=1 Tax=Anabaena sp. FACHB-1237 TaxID=2692769 RepID=UPI0016804845|nr:extracellular solute-binding protein [Anabaena sp. FACHB-1237]MBD2139384.1 extracellular solute-binding protein [Anabaena sp. FACHB-1237]
MKRRSFLLGISTLAISQSLIACANKNREINIQLLRGSIPGQIVNQFNKSIKSQEKLKFILNSNIQEIFKKLQVWRNPNINKPTGWKRYLPLQNEEIKTPDPLATLGDYWLQAAIRQQLIQPLTVEKIPNWGNLDQRWQELVKRDNQIWGIPYRWGNTVIIYNREKLKQMGGEIRDWSDLWRSELKLRISLIDHPREVIGLVLKKLGKSYNTENISEIANLESELNRLNQQVKFYDSTTYLEPLIMGDTWVAVGWLDDITPVLNRYPRFTAIIPKSGTAISADVWVKPTGTNNNDVVDQWLDFCLQPNNSQTIALLTKSNSPLGNNFQRQEVPQTLYNLLLTNRETFAKSEFLLPLSAKAQQEYTDLFMKIKQSDLTGDKKVN